MRQSAILCQMCQNFLLFSLFLRSSEMPPLRKLGLAQYNTQVWNCSKICLHLQENWKSIQISFGSQKKYNLEALMRLIYLELKNVILDWITYIQWRNRQGAKFPQRLLTRKFQLTYWEKKRQGKKEKRGENWEEKKENCKREGGKLEIEGVKVTKWGEDFFFFFFFFAFHFSKPQKFVLGLQKWKVSTGKKHFTPGKKSGKWLCPLRKIFLLRPCLGYCLSRK